LKELWVEIDQAASDQEKENLLNLSHENADVTILEGQTSNRTGKLNISFITELNEKKLAHLRGEGKKNSL